MRDRVAAMACLFVSAGVMTHAIALEPSGKSAETNKAAIAKSLPLLQYTDETWLKKRNCTSCHHQSLGMATFAMAKEYGFPVDRKRVDAQVADVFKRRSGDWLKQFEVTGAINGNAGFSFGLFGYSTANVAPSNATDAIVYYLLASQAADGSWRSLSHRPPHEDSPVTMTAFAVRGVSLYAPIAWQIDVERQLANARKWLTDFRPVTNEEKSMRIMGLVWAGVEGSVLQSAAHDLMASQRPDGGWAQLATRDSDAYATGQSMVALRMSGVAAAKSLTKGERFLRQTQHADGSWLVTTRRRMPGLPYFETGFPHRQHQFISVAGSMWATMALMLAERPEAIEILSRKKLPRSVRKHVDYTGSSINNRIFDAILFGDVSHVEAALEGGAEVNAKNLAGATPLMFAVRKPEIVKLLLAKGAEVHHVSASGATALLLAAIANGGDESVRLLLAAGAKTDVYRAGLEGPLLAAAVGGHFEKVDMLLAAGADYKHVGADAASFAGSAGYPEMMAKLIRYGTDVNTMSEEGQTFLHYAVQEGSVDVVRTLLELGANPNTADNAGLTPLMLGAISDPGHGKIVELLLKSGADPTIKLRDGRSALSLAQKYKFKIAERLISAALVSP